MLKYFCLSLCFCGSICVQAQESGSLQGEALGKCDQYFPTHANQGSSAKTVSGSFAIARNADELKLALNKAMQAHASQAYESLDTRLAFCVLDFQKQLAEVTKREQATSTQFKMLKAQLSADDTPEKFARVPVVDKANADQASKMRDLKRRIDEIQSILDALEF